MVVIYSTKRVTVTSTSDHGTVSAGRDGMSDEMVTVQGVEMTAAAARWVEETGVDVAQDVEDLRQKNTGWYALQRDCEAGVEADDGERKTAIAEYIEAVRLAADV